MRKINLIWIIGITLVLVLPIANAGDVSESWGFVYDTNSQWAAGQHVYIKVNPNLISPTSKYRLKVITKTPASLATGCQVFLNTQQHTDTPVASGTFSGNDCTLSSPYDMSYDTVYYITNTVTGSNQDVRQDSSESYPKTGTLVTLTGAGYGDSGAWTAQDNQERSIASFTGEEISSDATPPTINISINNTNPLRNDVVNVTARVTDETSLASCFLWNNVSVPQISSTKTLTGTTDQCSFTFRLPYTLTTYNLTLNVSDSAGNKGVNSTSVTVNPPVYSCPVGSATSWSWTPITISSMIPNGTSYSWKWTQYAI